jgi:hypothetical protein
MMIDGKDPFEGEMSRHGARYYLRKAAPTKSK